MEQEEPQTKHGKPKQRKKKNKKTNPRPATSTTTKAEDVLGGDDSEWSCVLLALLTEGSKNNLRRMDDTVMMPHKSIRGV
jgi:hypothetical protein